MFCSSGNSFCKGVVDRERGHNGSEGYISNVPDVHVVYIDCFGT